MFKFITLLALCGVAMSQRNPNPCVGLTGSNFVNDYGNCPAYFWCNGVVAFAAGPCPAGSVFFDGGCLASVDPLDCVACPAGATGTIAVTHPLDTNCTTYHFCRGETRDLETVVVTCGAGLRFNAITGMCARAENVDCRGVAPPGPPGSGNCADSTTGDVNNVASCAAFDNCDELGAINPDGPFDCLDGLHFNPAPNLCDLPEALDPICEDAVPASARKWSEKIPSAPLIQAPTSVKDRIMRKLHLRH